jgi:hypothetical protein
VGQNAGGAAIDITGCWRTMKYTTAHEETVFPAEVNMVYEFHCDGSYVMSISNGSEKKQKRGLFTLSGGVLALKAEGDAEPVQDTVAFLDGGTLVWHVELDGEKGTFSLRRVVCSE